MHLRATCHPWESLFLGFFLFQVFDPTMVTKRFQVGANRLGGQSKFGRVTFEPPTFHLMVALQRFLQHGMMGDESG